MVSDTGMIETERFEARLRPIPLLIAAGACALFIWLVCSQEGDFRLMFALGFALALAYGTYRFYRERRIVREGGTAMAIVTEYRQVPSSDGSSDRECKYRFTAANGLEYVGGCESTIRDFPEEGCQMAIVYNQQNPDDNFPREMFWFYDT
ncbi:MAG TPA: DUF3592 domain-containing protein [Candidatus Angelobacter sp.]|jgi:hypothetical protein|nr:DUF3592 domain-containing protein [Candidatus Angelobacter sp.]